LYRAAVAPSVRDAVGRAIPAVRGALGRVARARRDAPTPAPAPEETDAAAAHRDVVERMERALRAHDLEALVACFHADYRGEQPLHPREATVDREQVRRNWETFFANVPDVRADLLATAYTADTVWSEWRIYGTRRDGTPLDLRGVWIFGVRDGKVAWGRLYREPIDLDDEPDTVERLTRP
jgi:ketosteroid isomerase-like protein